MRKLWLASLLAISFVACARPVAIDDDTGVSEIDAAMVRRDAYVAMNDAASSPDAFVGNDATTPPRDSAVPGDAARCDLDADGDGYFAGGGCPNPDCDDSNTRIYPGAPESCDNRDQDCDDTVDEGLGEASCGVGACARTVAACMNGAPQTCAAGTPGTEVCDGVDNDCDTSTDEGFSAPITCGMGACMRMVASCTGGTPMMCEPGAPRAEQCNAIDDDCDGNVDEQIADLVCGTGACRVQVAACVNNSLQTCTPGNPGSETCNAIDDDCDGVIDNRLGETTCGVGACRRTVSNCVGGVITTCTAGAPGTESCNNVDDDCDGNVDENLGSTTCGVGACQRTVTNCMSGAPQMCMPGAASAEVCGNAVDENCDGVVGMTPPNATCATASAYTIGATVMGDTSCGGADITAPSTCGSGARGAENVYSVAGTGMMERWRIRMTGAGSYDTVLHVANDVSCTTNRSVACNDDLNNMDNVSEVIVDAPAAGVTYFVIADSFATNGGGSYTLTSSTGPVAYDNCGDPMRIHRAGTFTGTFPTPTVSEYPPGALSTCSPSLSGSGGPDVVFSVTPRVSGSMTIDTTGSNFDTVLYVGTTCGTGTVACNDDRGGTSGAPSSVTFNATAGTTYFVVLDSFSNVLMRQPNPAWTLNVTGGF